MTGLEKILPQTIFASLDRINWNYLQEIRLRLGKPAALLYSGKKCFLGKHGVCLESTNALPVSKDDIEHTLLNACEHSLHTYSGQMTKGFVMLGGGVRLGVCGTAVTDEEKVISFKDVCALNIRIPREVKDCSLPACHDLLNPLKNILIVSKPGAGKTTFLRDLIYQTSKLANLPNVLVADERNEIAGAVGGAAQFDLGAASDVISLTSKAYVFVNGLRTMAPDIIACDEIVPEDVHLLNYAKNCGVKIFATVHANDLDELAKKENFSSLQEISDRFVVLSCEKRPGEIAGVFGKDLRPVDNAIRC